MEHIQLLGGRGSHPWRDTLCRKETGLNSFEDVTCTHSEVEKKRELRVGMRLGEDQEVVTLCVGGKSQMDRSSCHLVAYWKELEHHWKQIYGSKRIKMLPMRQKEQLKSLTLFRICRQWQTVELQVHCSRP